ncbi:hypothetical protein A2154_02365 [Candidatus Gottesmanbacteria bacterium RBG_16_43_7]|uniref:Methyltransferase small domain-containing protein n=1 Tax=Candidatus Gottesmanbacteria bacterium RBG_16_43_7 TaxID=1798373 RepID=A0A1F5Z8D3_9BACT|nr:MAG: hypothetical protein A2154_02365 [Candidatus Gottesmanbacteria bacterium RBG_16_43_7]
MDNQFEQMLAAYKLHEFKLDRDDGNFPLILDQFGNQELLRLAKFAPKPVSYWEKISAEYSPGVISAGIIFLTDIPELDVGGATVLHVTAIPKDVIEHPYIYYWSSMVRAISVLDLSNRRVVDFGSGSGTLSILALLKQAQHVVLIDHNTRAIRDSFDNLYSNTCATANNFTIEHKTFRDLLYRSRQGEILPEVEVGFASIGPHIIYGGQFGAQMEAYELVKRYGTAIRTMVLGGYGRNINGVDLTAVLILDRYEGIGFKLKDIFCVDTKGQRSFYSYILER